MKDDLMNNFTITANDINRAEITYGPAVPYTRTHDKKTPTHSQKNRKRTTTSNYITNHRTIALSMDFFFVNGKNAFDTKSDEINFITAQYCTSRSPKTIMTKLEGVTNK